MASRRLKATCHFLANPAKSPTINISHAKILLIRPISIWAKLANLQKLSVSAWIPCMHWSALHRSPARSLLTNRKLLWMVSICRMPQHPECKHIVYIFLTPCKISQLTYWGCVRFAQSIECRSAQHKSSRHIYIIKPINVFFEKFLLCFDHLGGRDALLPKTLSKGQGLVLRCRGRRQNRREREIPKTYQYQYTSAYEFIYIYICYPPPPITIK